MLLCDKSVRELIVTKNMITNAVLNQVREVNGKKIISYGLSSAGYDVRLAPNFKVFNNLKPTIIDPLNFDGESLVETTGDYCIIPPNSYMLGHTIEIFDVPRDILIECLGKSTIARCFTGDTKVALANGTSATFLEMLDGVKKGERYFGYGMDDTGEIVMTELVAPRLIGEDVIYAITLDSGEVIECTGDHNFLLRDGTYVEAKDLSEGTSLMALYRVVSRGYEAVVQLNSWALNSTHWLADRWNIRHGIYQPMENSHRHHKDHNRRNNYPSNVERQDASEHISYHNNQMWANPEMREKLTADLVRRHPANSGDSDKIERFKAHCRTISQAFWHDDQYADIRAAFMEKQKERIKNASEATRERWRNTGHNLARNMKKSEKWKEAMENMWLSLDRRKQQSEIARNINIRKDITEEVVRDALEKTGSIRGAARMLNCDRTTFRRFKSLVKDLKRKWDSEKITVNQIVDAFKIAGSMQGAARLLGVSKSYVFRRKDALSAFFNTPVAENHKVVSVVKTHRKESVYCLTAPDTGNFALEAGVFVKNCGLIVNVTPIEPGFKGQVVIEIANTTPLPVKVYANMGIAQFLFFQMDEECETSYGDRGGKYQNQMGITLARV